ncbi:probable WRKY transcription factor 4 [Musa acuminata AAA Group]|uniref:probable WRKY transcription factor 4 n=1 Tax=Musa acuminata AAA Group TaxID=214697 RepID=UPI0031D5B86E
MTEEGDGSATPQEDKPRGGDDDGGTPPSPSSERPPPADLGSDATAVVKGGGSGAVPAAKADGRSFSQLLAGAMASPVGSPRPPPILTVPVVAVPCLLAPAALIESPGFTGQFAMTHQAVLAAVTAQAQMQMQAAYPPPSETTTNSFPHSMLPAVSPVPLQQMSSVPEACSGDIYHWRKYGQKQVKNTENFRSYYRCADSNCLAKKKVECYPDGKICDVIYRGKHNHDPPQKYRYTRDRGAQSGGSSRENESIERLKNELNESGSSSCKAEQNSGNDTPEQQLDHSSDCKGVAGVTTKKDFGDEPDPKRRLSENTKSFSMPVPKQVKEHVVQTEIDAKHLSDGYRWRKYGQKLVKGNPNPRSYYRCTHDGCPVRKHVERASHDAQSLLITYEGKHNHDQPTPKFASDQPASDSPVKETDSKTSLSDRNSSKDLNPNNLANNLTGDKASEFGGHKAPEGAQSLPSSKGGSESTDPDGMRNPLLSENPAAVPVENC